MPDFSRHMDGTAHGQSEPARDFSRDMDGTNGQAEPAPDFGRPLPPWAETIVD